MNDCIFCMIAKGDIPSEKVYEDEMMVAFKDINPMAPVHVLFIPKKHIENLGQLTDEDILMVGKMMQTIGKVAKDVLKVEENGYRIISNCGKDAGQTVPHLHFHLLAGKELPVTLG